MNVLGQMRGEIILVKPTFLMLKGGVMKTNEDIKSTTLAGQRGETKPNDV